MADNTTLNAGSGGDTYASDDVTTLNGGASSGIKVQRVKLMTGPDGTATDVNTGISALSVQGSAAIGAGANGNPILMGGQDGSSNAQMLNVDSSGRIRVNGAAAAGAAVAGNPVLIAGAELGAVNILKVWGDGSISVGDNSGSLTVDAPIGTPVYARITDGTNTMPTMDVASRAGFHKVTDGTNTMPTMDVASRAGFQKVTDGTNTAAVKAASTAAIATDPALVVSVSPNNSVAITGTVTASSATGAAASGAAVSGNPVLVAGSDATNARTLLTDTSGSLSVVPKNRAIYRTFVPLQAAGASKVYFDLFNATSSGKTLRLLSCVPIVSGAVGVTGVVAVDLFLTRTSAVGTGGTAAVGDAVNGGSASTSLTALTIALCDPTDAQLPTQVTARLAPTGGATAGQVLSMCSVFTEETSAASYYGHTNDLANRNRGIDFEGISMATNTGIRIVQGTVASVGNIGFDLIFSAE
jgi:hypothetical protein